MLHTLALLSCKIFVNLCVGPPNGLVLELGMRYAIVSVGVAIPRNLSSAIDEVKVVAVFLRASPFEDGSGLASLLATSLSPLR